MSNVNTESEALDKIGQIQSLEDKLNSLLLNLDSQIKEFKNTVNKVKMFKKDVRNVELKISKLQSKRSRNNDSKKNKGYFLMPVQISDELIKFIKSYGLVSLESHKYPTPKGTDTQKRKMREKNEKDRVIIPSLIERIKNLEPEEGKNMLSRVDVTRLISKFVQYYGLQNQEEKKLIKLDSSEASNEFKNLLSTDDYSKLSFINVHKYIKHHFYNKKANGFPEKETNVTEEPVTEPVTESVVEPVVEGSDENTIEVPQTPKKKPIRRKRKRAAM